MENENFGALKCEFLPIEKIFPYENNPRKNDGAVDACANSLRTFGFRQPIVVDANHVIIAGHTRYKAAQKLGLKFVPVHVASDLTPKQTAEYRVVDNKTGELSEWDLPQLKIELNALIGPDFNALDFGFSDAELDALFADAGFEGKTDPNDAPEPPEKSSLAPGALVRLGRHVLVCGDATKPEDVFCLFGDEKVDLLLTDPPYNVDYTGGTGLKIENDSMSDDQFLDFLTAAFQNANKKMRPGAAFYVWHADSEGLNFRTAIKNVGWKTRECLIWVKNALVMGRQDYHWRHEPCLYGWKDGASHYWCGDRTQTTALEFPKPAKSEIHPTMKSVELFERLILNSSRRDALVYDPFLGSGTSIIAAERTGRQCFGLELSPRYCDAIIKRWEDYTGEKAEVVFDGHSGRDQNDAGIFGEGVVGGVQTTNHNV